MSCIQMFYIAVCSYFLSANESSLTTQGRPPRLLQSSVYTCFCSETAPYHTYTPAFSLTGRAPQLQS